MVRRKARRVTRRASGKKPMGHGCCGKKHIIIKGILLLLIAAAFYFGYGWMEIFGALGILAIIKGLLFCK